jgi:hypothetical protein
VLVHPRRWVVDQPPVGSDAVHELLIGWLDQLGQRKRPEVETVDELDQDVEGVRVAERADSPTDASVEA